MNYRVVLDNHDESCSRVLQSNVPCRRLGEEIVLENEMKILLLRLKLMKDPLRRGINATCNYYCGKRQIRTSIKCVNASGKGAESISRYDYDIQIRRHGWDNSTGSTPLVRDLYRWAIGAGFPSLQAEPSLPTAPRSAVPAT